MMGKVKISILKIFQTLFMKFLSFIQKMLKVVGKLSKNIL